MSHPLRIEYPGVWYHVMNLGTRRLEVFLNDTHRNTHCELFLELLRELFVEYGVETHAYCLTDNHYHLLCHTPQRNLEQGIRYFNDNGVYKIGGMAYPAIAAHYNLVHYEGAVSAIIHVQEDEQLLRKSVRFRRKWNHAI